MVVPNDKCEYDDLSNQTKNQFLVFGTTGTFVEVFSDANSSFLMTVASVETMLDLSHE